MRNKHYLLLPTPVTVALDATLILCGVATAVFLRFGFEEAFRPSNKELLLRVGPLVVLLTLVVFGAFDLYGAWVQKKRKDLVISLIGAVLVTNALLFTLVLFFRGYKVSLMVALLAFPIQVGLLCWFRVSVQQWQRWLSGKLRVLVVCEDGTSCEQLRDKFDAHDDPMLVVHDCITASEYNRLDEVFQRVNIVAVMSNFSRKAELLCKCEAADKEVMVVPDLSEISAKHARLQQIDDLLVFSYGVPCLTPVEALMKRCIDVVGASVLLIVSAPVLLLLYWLIPRDSPGPAIFRQERLGLRGKPYMLYKFRTMIQDAERLTGATLATSRDPRITRLGGFLRRTRLDEVPQLINVLRGEMSLVGPRPERQIFVEQFAANIPNYSRRLCAKPGVTGLAQIMGRYSTTATDKLRFDLMYLHNYSLLLDLKILLQTVAVVLQPERADGVTIRQPASAPAHMPEAAAIQPEGPTPASPVDVALSPSAAIAAAAKARASENGINGRQAA